MKMRITMNDVPYKTVQAAFDAIGYPLNKAARFRTALYLEKEKKLEWKNAMYTFKVIENKEK